jgi:biopolymer transport protein ExbD
MSRFDPKNIYDRPVIQMIPLIDIMFFALIFFMILSAYYHVESQLDITVPKSAQNKDAVHSPNTVVINVNATGMFMVNGESYNSEGLDNLLKRLSALSHDQAVIIRADEKTFHKYIIETLDICARNNIQDISFATSEGQQ